MAKIERFEELKCWQSARTLTKEIYSLTSVRPLAKDFRLRDQLTGASVSVMSNIAEGFSRYHRRKFIRFLDIAQSSVSEVKSLLYVAHDQEYATPNQIKELQNRCEECQKLTLGLLRYLHRTIEDGQKVREAASPYGPKGITTALDLPGEFVQAVNKNT